MEAVATKFACLQAICAYIGHLRIRKSTWILQMIRLDSSRLRISSWDPLIKLDFNWLLEEPVGMQIG